MTILDHINNNTLKEVALRQSEVSIKTLESSVYFDRNVYSLKASIANSSQFGIIAEVKFKSPSKGVINDKLSPQEVGEGYYNVGASAISVLTDIEYFGGKMEYLTAVRECVKIPVLRKDFILTEYQIVEAKSIGADAILLIAASMTPERLSELAKFAHSLGLEVLMEVHDLEELQNFITPNIDVVGVNNRNLKTMDVSIQTSIDLVEHIPTEFVKISESGIRNAATIHQLRSVGYQGFLIGESFMTTENPGKALNTFIKSIFENK
jgi:indole-3-glycerol phosphate synthase